MTTGPTPGARARRAAGAARAGTLAVLLLALVGAGGWNYWRNLRIEQAEHAKRPFAGYADADLRALADAYRGEVESWRQREAAARQGRPAVREQGFVGDGVRQFERVQRHSARAREAATGLAEREARLQEIEKELAYRADLGSGLALHLRRLTRL